MKKNNPEPPPPPEVPEPEPNIQMTPVEFSPPAADAIGSIGGFRPLHEMQFPVAIPITLILLTLIFSTVRDIGGFNRRLNEIQEQNAPALDMLKRAPKQMEYVESMRVDLQKLAPTDPTAAQILQDFFPAQPPPPKPDAQAGAAPSQ
jgi:hypothetical protein